MTNDELLNALESLENTLIAVATGGPRINDVNEGYQRTYANVAADLARRGIDKPIAAQLHRRAFRAAGEPDTNRA